MDPPDDGRSRPSTSSVIKDGAVSGVLPAAEAFAIHYPGYPSSTERAVETLGGLPEIAKVRNSESGAMELRFRPEDPYCHPAVGNLHPSSSLLLRISKFKGGAERSSGERSMDEANGGGQEGTPAPAESLSAEVVARVRHAYRFEGMVDYQHVLAVHAAEERRKKRPWALEGELDLEEDVSSGMDGADVMMLVPPFFTLKDRPETLVLNPSVNLFSRNFQRGVVEHCWEMDIEPCLAIAFDIERVPIKINWEDNIPKDTIEWEWQMATCKLFEERPIWPRWSLHERLLEDGLEVSENQLKRLLFRAGYYFSTGPFGRFWIRKGYDPRKDPESRIYQKVDFRVPSELRDMNTNTKLKQTWKDLCQFQVVPSKNFVFLQFFELIDEFIQHEIRKPPDQETCTHATGWFSTWKLRTLRLHVRIRFLSLYPNGAAEGLLESSRELYERSKKEEVFSRFQKPENEAQRFNEVPNCSAGEPCTESKGQEDQEAPNNCEVEDEEEEEEELDGYEYPPVVREDGYFPLDGFGKLITMCAIYLFGENKRVMLWCGGSPTIPREDDLSGGCDKERLAVMHGDLREIRVCPRVSKRVPYRKFSMTCHKAGGTCYQPKICTPPSPCLLDLKRVQRVILQNDLFQLLPEHACRDCCLRMRKRIRPRGAAVERARATAACCRWRPSRQRNPISVRRDVKYSSG